MMLLYIGSFPVCKYFVAIGEQRVNSLYARLLSIMQMYKI